MKHITRILALALLVTTVVACEKDEKNDGTTNPEKTVSALVLNEGGWGANNSSITAIDLTEGEVVNADWFSAKNDRGLGDVAQDMLQYGSKVYTTVSFSNSLEVINPKTGVSQRVDMGGRQPRSIAAANGKLYITCYNPRCVVRIDTTTFEIEATCTLGDYQPEGIAIADGKAFVASCFVQDGANYVYDNKVYVIDLASFSNPTTIEVGANPSVVKKLNDNKVMVCYAGDYATLPAGSAIIDANSLTVTQTNTEMANFDVYNGKAYGYASTWVEINGNWEQTIGYKTISADGTVSDFPFTFSISGNPYGISINPANGDIYLMTDGNYTSKGTVYCFSQSGDLRFMLEAGMLPKKVVVL